MGIQWPTEASSVCFITTTALSMFAVINSANSFGKKSLIQADLVAFTAADFTGIHLTMADSTTADFTITGFSSVDRSHIRGGAITRTMGITATANPTPRRLGTTVPILPAITLM